MIEITVEGTIKVYKEVVNTTNGGSIETHPRIRDDENPDGFETINDALNYIHNKCLNTSGRKADYHVMVEVPFEFKDEPFEPDDIDPGDGTDPIEPEPEPEP